MKGGGIKNPDLNTWERKKAGRHKKKSRQKQGQRKKVFVPY